MLSMCKIFRELKNVKRYSLEKNRNFTSTSAKKMIQTDKERNRLKTKEIVLRQ